MKRYLLFYGPDYYPDGGIRDFVGDFDTVEEATDKIHLWIKEGCAEMDYTTDEWLRRSWAHIYDSQTRVVMNYPDQVQ